MQPETKMRAGHPVAGADFTNTGLNDSRHEFCERATKFVLHSYIHLRCQREVDACREWLPPGHVLDNGDFASGWAIRPKEGWQDQVYNTARHSMLVRTLQ